MPKRGFRDEHWPKHQTRHRQKPKQGKNSAAKRFARRLGRTRFRVGGLRGFVERNCSQAGHPCERTREEARPVGQEIGGERVFSFNSEQTRLGSRIIRFPSNSPAKWRSIDRVPSVSLAIVLARKPSLSGTIRAFSGQVRQPSAKRKELETRGTLLPIIGRDCGRGQSFAENRRDLRGMDFLPGS